jgi:hypothetical protein
VTQQTQQTQHRFPWRVTAVVAAIVIATTAVAGVILARNGVQQANPSEPSIFTPAPDLLPIEKKRQVTLLVQVRDRRQELASSVLIGAGGDTGFIAELLLPRDLLLPTTPPVLLKDTNGPRGPVSAQGPLQVLLGVQIDAAIELDRLAWAGLIDSGAALTDPELGQDAATFPLVLDKVLASLPPDEQTIGQLLTSLGSMAPTSVTNEDASHLLALVGEGARTLPVKRQVLPVTYIRGGSTPVATTRQPEAGSVVSELFPKAPLQPGHDGPVRVVLEQCGSTVGGVITARAELGRAGFGVVLGHACGTAPSSAVYVPAGTPEAVQHGRDVATALGLPAASVVVDSAPDGVVDVRVRLGSDYSPV